ncbi:SMEK domain-containing protein [Acinetobacter bereziniae]|uniref:SMEK domain-containing protein n=1 Tax=Acinetobacter bereziniae TaxID=106648 RepID=UPI0021D257F7|nr:SMEK domain-containing protein [Acinetobacter bereziniae]MCU4434701.1 SMEK domain-containing protein [Acinetobacter bereziniae]
MQPNRMEIGNKLRFFFSTIYAQTKLGTRSGLNDLAKSHEKSLLPIINKVFDTKFIDMNDLEFNSPAIDYGDFDNRLSLQMTVTLTNEKVKKTIEKFENHGLNEKFNELWILFIYVEPIPKKSYFKSKKVKVINITLHQVIDRILSKELKIQIEILDLIEREYSSYFRSATGLRIPQKINIPSDLSKFNDFIETKEWFMEDPNQGYKEVYEFISKFQDNLLNCSETARNLITDIFLIQRIPKELNSKIELYVEKLFGRLNLNPDDPLFESYIYYLEQLQSNHLIELQDKFPCTKGDTIHTEKFVILKYMKFEPEINLFIALANFYIKYHSIHDFFRAIENADFTLLSDEEIEKVKNIQKISNY